MLRLGLRQWRKTAAMAAAGYLGDGGLFLLDYALRGLRVVVLLSIWRTVLDANPGASPMPLEALLTYTLIAEVFGAFVRVSTPLSDALWQGTIVNHFLRPMGVVRQFAAEASGRWLVDLALFSLPLLLLAPLLGVDAMPADLTAGGVFIISLVLAVAVGLAIEFFFGALALALDQTVWVIDWVRVSLVRVLSGSLVPLAVLPWGLGEVFEWLPFASVAWAPLSIYTGTGEALPLIALQAFWALTLWPLALAMWRGTREKMVAYGG